MDSSIAFEVYYELTGHDYGWDGHNEGRWCQNGPTFDIDSMDGMNPAERAEDSCNCLMISDLH